MWKKCLKRFWIGGRVKKTLMIRSIGLQRYFKMLSGMQVLLYITIKSEILWFRNFGKLANFFLAHSFINRFWCKFLWMLTLVICKFSTNLWGCQRLSIHLKINFGLDIFLCKIGYYQKKALICLKMHFFLRYTGVSKKKASMEV